MYKLFSFNKDIKMIHYLFHRNLTSCPKPVCEVMSNGMKLVTEKTNSPLLCASIFIQNGSRYENTCNNGISNFIELVSTSRNEIQENIYNSNTVIKSKTTREYQMFSAVCPTECSSEGIELLSKILSDQEYDKKEIECQKNKLCFESEEYDKNPKAVLFDYLHQTAFQGTPLGQSVIGPTRNIEKFDTCAIKTYKKENFHSNRLLLAVSGDIANSSIIKSVCSNLNLSKSKECNPLCDQKRYTGSQIVYRDDSMPYAHVAIAVEAPGYNSSEYLPFLVASSLSGSWDRTQGGKNTLASPLAEAASRFKLCEKFESFYIAYHDVGLWGVYFIGNKLHLDDMMCNIQDQWMNMCTTIVQADVQRAVNATKLKLAKQVNGVINSCCDMGLQLLYKPERKSLKDFYGELSKITDKMIKRIGHDYIYDKCPVVAAIGPTETLPNYARTRSGMYWLRL